MAHTNNVFELRSMSIIRKERVAPPEHIIPQKAIAPEVNGDIGDGQESMYSLRILSIL